MARKRKVDAAKVFEAVESGRLGKEVMESFGLEKRQSRTNTSSKRRGVRAAGTYEISGPLAEISISKRGSLVLSKELINKLGLNQDSSFIVRKTKTGLILKPIFSDHSSE